MSKKKPNLTQRCGVRGYIPQQKMLEIATGRTDCLVDAFMVSGASRASILDGYKHLQNLARSAYMQGVHDAIEAVGRDNVIAILRTEAGEAH